MEESQMDIEGHIVKYMKSNKKIIVGSYNKIITFDRDLKQYKIVGIQNLFPNYYFTSFIEVND